jgi:hypothetical protein
MSRTFGIADLPKLNRDDGPYTYDALRDTAPATSTSST